MKIQPVQSNQAFTGSQHFLSKDAHKDLLNVLIRLNKETKYSSKGKTFTSEIAHTINLGKEAVLYDERCYYVPVPMERQAKGFSELFFKKEHLRLHINNQTGEIEKYRKPFFMSWKKALKKAENVIKTLNDEYNNSEKVDKHVINVAGLLRDALGSISK